MTKAAADTAEATEIFGARLKAATHALHRQAEQSGILADILRGTCTRPAYMVWLRNLHAVYDRLEAELTRHITDPSLSAVAFESLFRAPALGHDLTQLAGPAWPSRLPLLPPAARYAARIELAGRENPILLLAHAYVRYLGDLHGGQILRQRLEKSLFLTPDTTRFYHFSLITNRPHTLKTFRDSIDHAGPGIASQFILEAQLAFEYNIEISEAIKQDVLF